MTTLKSIQNVNKKLSCRFKIHSSCKPFRDSSIRVKYSLIQTQFGLVRNNVMWKRFCGFIFIGYFFLLQCTYRNCNYLLFRIGLQTMIFYSLFKMISKYSRKDTQTNQKKSQHHFNKIVCRNFIFQKHTFLGKTLPKIFRI